MCQGGTLRRCGKSLGEMQCYTCSDSQLIWAETRDKGEGEETWQNACFIILLSREWMVVIFRSSLWLILSGKTGQAVTANPWRQTHYCTALTNPFHSSTTFPLCPMFYLFIFLKLAAHKGTQVSVNTVHLRLENNPVLLLMNCWQTYYLQNGPHEGNGSLQNAQSILLDFSLLLQVKKTQSISR